MVPEVGSRLGDAETLRVSDDSQGVTPCRLQAAAIQTTFETPTPDRPWGEHKGRMQSSWSTCCSAGCAMTASIAEVCESRARLLRAP